MDKFIEKHDLSKLTRRKTIWVIIAIRETESVLRNHPPNNSRPDDFVYVQMFKKEIIPM